MFEIKVTVEIPALVEAAKILAMRQVAHVEAKPEKIAQVEAKPEKIAQATAPAPVVPVAPTAVPAPVTAPPTTAVAPPAGPTRAEVATAGAQLLSQQPALQAQLVALLGKYGAQTVQDVPEAQLGAFAADLRAMGARI